MADCERYDLNKIFKTNKLPKEKDLICEANFLRNNITFSCLAQYGKLVKQLKFLENNLTDIQLNSLNIYLQDSRPINKYLSSSQNKPGAIKTIILEIDSIFDQIPALKTDLIVYRGVNVQFDQIVEQDGYTSTTLYRPTAEMFGKTIINIRIKKGSKVIPMHGLAEDSRPKEHEILLPRGFKLFD